MVTMIIDNSTLKGSKPSKELSAVKCKPSRALKISSDTMATDFSPRTCGCEAPDITDLCVQIRRGGASDWLAQYDAFSVTDAGMVRFVWDSNLTAAQPGYYEAYFYKDDCLVGQELIRLSKDRVVYTDRHTNIKCAEPFEPAAPPAGMITDVFDEYTDFSCALAAVLEKGALTVALCDDKTLEGLGTLCRPVELVIEDGMNLETVTYDGNAEGTIVRGSPCFRFPKGAVIKFAWTENNVTAAVEGC